MNILLDPFGEKDHMPTRTIARMFSFILFLAVAAPISGFAGVNVNVGVNAPLPPLPVPAPPPLIPISGSYVYFAPDVDVDIIFYRGSWYRPHEGRWYRAAEYNGSWRPIPHGRVPAALINLPHGYRNMPGHARIPYGQVKKNWRTWERERHWDRHEKRNRHEGGSGRDNGRGHGRRRHDN